MVQVLSSRSFGTKFSQAFQPAMQQGIERFLEDESERKKHERKREDQKTTAQALGLPDVPLEPAVMAALLKEQKKDERNQKLLQSLGILDEGQEQGRGDVESPSMGRMEGVGNSYNPADLSDEQIAGLALINPQIASTLQQQKAAAIKNKKDTDKEKRRQFEADRTYHTGLASKSREKIAGLRESLPRKRNSLTLAKDAIEIGDTSFFSLDKLADTTGIDLFRTAKGAQLVTAGKENLLSNISRVSAKAQNQWLEQRLNSMFPKIGQSDEANLTTLAMLEGEMALDEAYLQAYDREATMDREKYDYERGDIDERAHKAIEPLEKKILDKTSYQLRLLYERELGVDKLRKMLDERVPHGTPLTVEMAQLLIEKYGDKAEKKAKQLGYTEPPEELYMEFIQ